MSRYPTKSIPRAIPRRTAGTGTNMDSVWTMSMHVLMTSNRAIFVMTITETSTQRISRRIKYFGTTACQTSSQSIRAIKPISGHSKPLREIFTYNTL
jgi:hypothetical protein